MDLAAPPGLSLVSVLSLLACSFQVFAAALLTCRYGGRSSAEDRWILLWLFYDVIVHLTLVWPIRIRFNVFIVVCFLLFIFWLFIFWLSILRKDHLSTCLWLGQSSCLMVRWLNSVSIFCLWVRSVSVSTFCLSDLSVCREGVQQGRQSLVDFWSDYRLDWTDDCRRRLATCSAANTRSTEGQILQVILCILFGIFTLYILCICTHL